MELTLKRKQKLDDRTLGELYIDGKLFCDTLEDKSRFTYEHEKLTGVKVYGETCIPTGKYEVIVSFSERFQKKLPLLLNVPYFTGIRIHSGNAPKDTEGCILLGVKDTKENTVLQSRDTMAKFMAKLEKATGKVFVTISEEVVPETVLRTDKNEGILPTEALKTGEVAPGTTLAQSSQPEADLTENALQWIVKSSDNPKKTAMTVKGLLLGQVPVLINIAQHFGLDVNSVDVIHSIAVSTTIMAVSLTAFGLGRKLYMALKAKRAIQHN